MHELNGKTKPNPDFYNIPALENCLAQFFSESKVVLRDSVESTNSWGMQLPLPQSPSSLTKAQLLLANTQTAGRGRMGSSWSSPPSGDIYMSLVLNGTFPFHSAGLIPLAMGLAVHQALADQVKPSVLLKWPNDVIAGGKKLAGILCEARLATDFVQSYVIGLGLNVEREQFPSELVGLATSLKLLEPGLQCSRTELLCLILQKFFTLWPLCLTRDVKLIEDYTAVCMNIGQEVLAQDQNAEAFSGIAVGVNEDGALLVERTSGETCAVHSGEVLVLP